MIFQVTTPKTKRGTRIVPMFADVAEALKSIPKDVNKCVVDGYSGFIFSNRFGELLNPHVVNRAIYRIIRDANAEEGEHEMLPHFSVHNLRHTFCTRMCENEPNVKVIQEIMGHRDISTTMDVYLRFRLLRQRCRTSNLRFELSAVLLRKTDLLKEQVAFGSRLKGLEYWKRRTRSGDHARNTAISRA